VMTSVISVATGLSARDVRSYAFVVGICETALIQ